jgi:hypothetical protein
MRHPIGRANVGHKCQALFISDSTCQGYAHSFLTARSNHCSQSSTYIETRIRRIRPSIVDETLVKIIVA